MFRTIDDFVTSWKWEGEQTGKVLAGLTDASLDQPVEQDGRTLGSIAWHLVTTLPDILGQAGLPVMGPSFDTPTPKSVRTIAHEYGRLSLSVVTSVRSKWTDAMLTDSVRIYAEPWTRQRVLTNLVLHQAHHRGQMTVLMRQAGLAVPGIYGPSREDWVARGISPAP